MDPTTANGNVLFLIVDDLRPELGCYARPQVHSPHIDAFAASATRFEKAFCQVPVCGASRASILTGLNPQRKRFVNFFTSAHKDAPGIHTLPEHMKGLGFDTRSRGKVFHNLDDSLPAWSQDPWRPTTADAFTYRDPENHRRRAAALARPKESGPKPLFDQGPAWEHYDAADSEYVDSQCADQLIHDLDEFAVSGKPFFLAGGFVRPHLPFIVPQKYWNLYDPAEIPVPSMERPSDVPEQMLHESGELCMMYTSVVDGKVDDPELARDLIHGYWASVSFLDAQIGRVLKRLEDLGLDGTTTVVLCVDHGWNLGEHGQWCKHCLYDTSLHVPLIIRRPGQSAGEVVSHPVSNVDIYPTLLQLLDMPQPEHELAGQDLLASDSQPKPVFSRFHDGESIRVGQWRYSEWRDNDNNVTGQTLFDHASDPGEIVNLASDPAHADTLAELSPLLSWD